MDDQQPSPGAVRDDIDLAFSTVRLKPGYEVGEVDEFLGRTTSELALPPGQRSMTGESVRQEAFTATRWAKGYSQDEVDAFRALLSAQLDQDASEVDS